jgi:DNA-binding MarR family transcriptional regulator
MTELIRKLGELATASRIKRLSDSLMQDVGRIYKEQGFKFEPKWFLIFYQLSQQKAMSVTELAREVGITYPAVNQLAAEMSKAGLVESSSDTKDKRKRLLSLTEKGRALTVSLRPLWEDIEKSTSDLLEELNCDFLQMVGQIEDSLDEKSMYQRVMERIRSRQYEDIQIIKYDPKYKKYFSELNREWLEEYFEVEAEDEKLLSKPEINILKPGGSIFFAVFKDEVVGTCALIKLDSNVYELAKMAVSAKFRGKLIGKKLAQVAIEKARKFKAERLIVRTNPKLDAANRLYRKLGFEYMGKDTTGLYKRPTVIMELKLNK